MRFSRVLTAVGVVAMTIVTFSHAYALQEGAPKAPKTAKVNASKPDTAPKAPRSDIAEKIASNPQLAAKLHALVPAGMTLEDAAAGFKNQGQFMAALHVSHNYDIPFDQLKAMMTGPDRKSLRQSLKALRPSADADAAVKIAERQAKRDQQVANK